MMRPATTLDVILGSIVDALEYDLSRSGFMYRIFSRTKSVPSIRAKLKSKGQQYAPNGKKMQDLLALRVTLYFSDDVDILHQYLKSKSNYLDETIDEDDEKTFCPKRLNLVMRVPDNSENEMKSYLRDEFKDISDLLDLTYEIQIRTILSEGWHEVEHDFRYKCQDDWAEFKEESRLLNGIFATLENSEWAMLTLFDKMAYSYYKKKMWTNMVRNKMRLRFNDKSLSDNVIKALNENCELAKDIFRARRSMVISSVLEKEFSYPLQYDTIVHLLNRIEVHDEKLLSIEAPPLKKEMDSLFGKVMG